jgi:hypothetical protein
MDNIILTNNLVRSNIINKSNKSNNYLNNEKNDSGIQENREKISRINIDSSYRNTESKNILDNNIIYLKNNPIDIIYNDINDTDIVIHCENHPYNVNDNIIIQGTQSTNIQIPNGLTFSKNSNIVCINHINHGINFDTINPIIIEISNFIGNINNNYYNNIPINEINNTFKVIPTVKKGDIPNVNFYCIQMDIVSNFDGTYNLSNISISFKTINGINLNLINANYPINKDQLNGFQTIYYTEPNLFKFKLQINNNISTYGCGLSNIWICKVLDFIEGYTNNNYYKISLKKTFYNITRIKLISTEFPNTYQHISSIHQNNMFYWRLFLDGSTIYSITLLSGNYTAITLQICLINLIKNVKRDNNIYNDCNCIIDDDTSTFQIEFFSNIILNFAISFKDGINFSDLLGRIIITHPSHNLIENCIITISNAIETDGIPEYILNNTFSIEQIINENTYQIILPFYIKTNNTETTNGGNNMTIRYPIKSQLLFTTNDTIGNILGFSNINQPYSYTGFNYINTNSTIYPDDIETKTNNRINLLGSSYILMSSNIYNEVNNTGLINNVFAKILLSGKKGYMLYNKYIQLCEYFNPPLNSLSTWEISFYDKYGNLYDFGNIEHSYTLEIYENYEY